MIGIFDSGLGGLSVLAAIARALPQADLLYFADTANVPYGDKSDAFIRERVLAIGKHLVAQGCSLIVVACNTATAAAVAAFRELASRAAGGRRRTRRQTGGDGVAQRPYRSTGNAVDHPQQAPGRADPAACRRRAGRRRRL
jgi:deoxyribodipyrimidine photolyase